MKIGKVKAKWVRITFEQKRKAKINSKNYQGLLANEVEVRYTLQTEGKGSICT